MIIYFAASAAMLAVDQLIKYWAVAVLKGREPLVVIKNFFRFRYVENDGAAFSMLEGKQVFLILITLAAALFFVYLVRTGVIHGKLGYWAVACVWGGAAGNFIDRLRLRYVIDMFDWCWFGFPVFNFADLCITAGALLFMAMIYMDYKQERGK